MEKDSVFVYIFLYICTLVLPFPMHCSLASQAPLHLLGFDILGTRYRGRGEGRGNVEAEFCLGIIHNLCLLPKE